MKCIILAAGKSERLRSVTNETPKCLIELGEKTLLQRTIENVHAVGIQEIGIVLGYKAGTVRDYVKRTFPLLNIKFAMNLKFDSTNNAFSLLMASEFYKSEMRRFVPSQAFLLLDSDIVFPKELLSFLIAAGVHNKVAVRVRGNHDDEEIRVKVNARNEITVIGKTVPLSETYGESIGIEIFSPATALKLFDVLESRIRNGVGRTEFYEAAFQQLINEGEMLNAVDISEFPCAEIDTPEDLDYVKTTILPALDQQIPL